MLYPLSHYKRDFFDPFKWDLNDFFDTSFPVAGEELQWSPTVDIYEEDGHYRVKADLPGIQQKDVKVSLENGVLTIKGERTLEHKEKGEDYHLVERRSGRFQRCFRLPGKVDAGKIDARFENGVLDVTLPKVEKEKEIQIKVN
ncbi:MAG: Hsp20/alpha crystallin family protein [bacterium]